MQVRKGFKLIAIAIFFAAAALGMTIMSTTIPANNPVGIIAALCIGMIFLAASVLATATLRR